MRYSFILALSFLFLVTLACGTSTSTPPTVTLDQSMVETVVAGTFEAMQSATELPSDSAAEQPTDPPPTEIPPTAEPTAEPPALVCLAHPGPHIIPQPAGFGANINTLAISFFDAVGQNLGNIQTAGMTWLAPDQIHIGGSLSLGIANIPLVYHSLENSGMLKRSEFGIANQLALAPNLVTLTGGEGSSVITFSTNDSDQAAGGWISYLYAGDLEAINGAQPLLTRSEGDGFVIYPLAVNYQDGIAQGVWYTLSMWGVGNINFAPYNGLYYFKFFDASVTEYLEFSNRLAGFSPDQTKVAHIQGAGGQPGGPGNSLTIRDLVTCQETVIPFNPSTNLGGGFVTFAPNNTNLSWLEANGPSNMEAQMRLRIADINGVLLNDSEFPNLSGLAGGEIPSYIRPVGWLADHLLLLEIGVPSLASPLVVVWAPDPNQPLNPALGANQSAPLADGVFGGFLYP
ncbi:MAG: hypothetical protein ISR58_04765 [Anaerolineales bacterium]|nr:hypothetical protein [Chloroflexota bacterium]MBL6980483.1 hypothetical protein [Anaerolineales bacterium]